MGADDIRHNQHGNTEYRLARQLKFYGKEDPPSRRVKPIPISVIQELCHHVYESAATPHDDSTEATCDMACIGFFYLCRPGEHTKNKTNAPFRLCDVRLYWGTAYPDWQTTPIQELDNATTASLVFTTQKNGVKGEVITHGMTGDPRVCPVRALVRRLTYHRINQSPPITPLCAFYERGRIRHVTSAALTKLLRFGIRVVTLTLGAALGITPDDVDARSLRAGGATALLCARVDKDDIMLFGRWKSDAMLRYLHIAYNPAVHLFARQMLEHGDYRAIPDGLNYDGHVNIQEDGQPD